MRRRYRWRRHSPLQFSAATRRLNVRVAGPGSPPHHCPSFPTSAARPRPADGAAGCAQIFGGKAESHTLTHLGAIGNAGRQLASRPFPGFLGTPAPLGVDTLCGSRPLRWGVLPAGGFRLASADVGRLNLERQATATNLAARQTGALIWRWDAFPGRFGENWGASPTLPGYCRTRMILAGEARNLTPRKRTPVRGNSGRGTASFLLTERSWL